MAERATWLRKMLRRRGPVAFVFSGGGPLGALQVGTLKALFEFGIQPDLVVGTSVGALNATFTGFDPTAKGVEDLERIWVGLADGDLFPGGRFRASWARMLVRGNRVFESSGIRRLVETRLPGARFEDAAIPLGVIATDLETGGGRLFTSGEVLLPLLASTAMPGVFPPVEIEGRVYTDGGVANNVPIGPAVNMGAQTVYVMNSTSHSLQRRPLQRPMDYLLHAFTLARAQRLEIEQELYQSKVRLVMMPACPLDFFVPFASMEHTERLIGESYEYAMRFLRGDGSIPVEQTEDAALEAIAPAK